MHSCQLRISSHCSISLPILDIINCLNFSHFGMFVVLIFTSLIYDEAKDFFTESLGLWTSSFVTFLFRGFVHFYTSCLSFSYWLVSFLGMSPLLDISVANTFSDIKAGRDNWRENSSLPRREKFLFKYFLLKFHIIAFSSTMWLGEQSLD